MPSRYRRDVPGRPFDEAMAAAFLARARAGEPIHGLLCEPGMPSRRAYDHWRAIEPPFAEATFALVQRRNATLRERGRARWRAFDPVLADRIVLGLNTGLALEAVLAADPALPCRPILRRWRREAPGFDRVLKTVFAVWRKQPAKGRRAPEALTQAVVKHIIEGGSFASYSRAPGGPSRTTLRRWVRADPHFAREVAWACEAREEWYEDQILMRVQGTPAGDVADRERSVGRLKRSLVRLRHRPGAVHRARAQGAETQSSGDQREPGALCQGTTSSVVS